MNAKQKIMIIVLFQIVLIIGSFLVLVNIESQRIKIGESINYAGLNRFLTVETHLEVHILYLENNFDEKPPSLEKLKENLLLIKDGGKINSDLLTPLPLQLEEDWKKTFDDYLIFESSIQNLKDMTSENTLYVHTTIDKSAEELIQSSNNLVSRLTEYLFETYLLLIRLQIALLLLNTFVHIFLVFMIFRIFNNDLKEKIQLERFATIGEIGANIVHDLRNPLTVIKGAFEILKLKKNDMDETFEKKQYEKINNSIDKIIYLTKDILDYVRSSELQKEEFDFSEIIQNSLNEITLPNQIQIKLPIQDYKIKADKIKLGIVISNLIKNSVEAINENGTITMNLVENQDYVVFSITDSGNKLSEDDISKIFQPLFTKKQHGTGLGLASCKRIIEQHEGKISASVNPTTFTISIPKK
ncbi:MAG: HAMP domain-containing histidine kinase [Nitrosarchaeum sp.]|nr:HAMP domain-containing histidine kinase [Nitrosarchaeum sp.]